MYVKRISRNDAPSDYGTVTGSSTSEVEKIVEWSVAILSSREELSTLDKTVRAALTACGSTNATVDVIVNGNRDLARNFVDQGLNLKRENRNSRNVRLRLWYIELPDKAHAWNAHVYQIAESSASVYFYIDGYAAVRPNALALLHTGLVDEPTRMAATGVPHLGVSAASLRKEMLKNGGIHGNLFAIRGATMQELRSMGFRIPLGLYRTDPLVGAIISFGLDPANNEWDTNRILVHPDVTWDATLPKPYEFAAIKGYTTRRFRQARGQLENQAIKQHMAIEKRSPSELPNAADDLIRDWARQWPHQARELCMKNWLCIPALRAARRNRGRSFIGKSEEPELLATYP